MNKKTNKKNSFLPRERKKMEQVSPSVTQLYKHALESIFANLSLPELARVSAVCRDWSAAVDSMRPIGALLDGKGSWPRTMRIPRLMRHVFEIHHKYISLNVSELASLCDIIKQCKSLRTVNLKLSYIGDGGAIDIAEAVRQSKSLMTVNLSTNGIGNAGASAIAEAIKQVVDHSGFEPQWEKKSETWR